MFPGIEKNKTAEPHLKIISTKRLVDLKMDDNSAKVNPVLSERHGGEDGDES